MERKYLKIHKRIFKEYEDYVGGHKAPEKSNENAPLYDVTLNGIFPEDIYSEKGAIYYKQGFSYDAESVAITQAYRDKPNAVITIYRAVPKVLTVKDKILDYEKQKAYIHKTGRMPKNVVNLENLTYYEYYDFLSDEIERLQKQSNNKEDDVQINIGDWVTINKKYALGHGKSVLNGKYKIISKKVKAKELWTDGNSIHEWGYDK